MRQHEIHFSYRVLQLYELDEADRSLVEAAKEATQTSYAPYSQFYVGAALRQRDGSVVLGSNQENAAFGAGCCAERTALYHAGAAPHPQRITDLAIAARRADGTFTPGPISPCGICRQMLCETEQRLGGPIRVLLYGTQGTLILPDAAQLLPLGFTSDDMATDTLVEDA